MELTLGVYSHTTSLRFPHAFRKSGFPQYVMLNHLIDLQELRTVRVEFRKGL